VTHTRIIVTHYGGPDSLRVVEEECPEPKDGEVRVRVLAAGVSLPDLLMREGVHPETPRLPFTPGWDLIGVVDKVGGSRSPTVSHYGVVEFSKSFIRCHMVIL
jgi:NADPH2:quinone reductase